MSTYKVKRHHSRSSKQFPVSCFIYDVSCVCTLKPRNLEQSPSHCPVCACIWTRVCICMFMSIDMIRCVYHKYLKRKDVQKEKKKTQRIQIGKEVTNKQPRLRCSLRHWLVVVTFQFFLRHWNKRSVWQRVIRMFVAVVEGIKVALYPMRNRNQKERQIVPRAIHNACAKTLVFLLRFFFFFFFFPSRTEEGT